MSETGILQLLEQLPERHRSALVWFEQNAGQEVGWPKPLPDGTFLATRAKGIYKPAWSKYALSVRQTLGGPYPDREVQVTADGNWVLEYFQEDLDPGRPNTGLQLSASRVKRGTGSKAVSRSRRRKA